MCVYSRNNLPTVKDRAYESNPHINQQDEYKSIGTH